MLDVGGNIVHHDACKLWALEGCFQVEIADVDTHEFCIKCQDSALEVESGGGEGCSSCCCFTQVMGFRKSCHLPVGFGPPVIRAGQIFT